MGDHEGLYPIHINFGVFVLHNLNGAIHHHDDQRWYYYPFQNESEVLVFTQYSKERHFCNPHGSFRNPNCPGDSDPRVLWRCVPVSSSKRNRNRKRIKRLLMRNSCGNSDASPTCGDNMMVEES